MTHKPWCERESGVDIDAEGVSRLRFCICHLLDPRDPTGANDRRDGKDRRAWGSPEYPFTEDGALRHLNDRRQSDRRGGE